MNNEDNVIGYKLLVLTLVTLNQFLKEKGLEKEYQEFSKAKMKEALKELKENNQEVKYDQ